MCLLCPYIPECSKKNIFSFQFSSLARSFKVKPPLFFDFHHVVLQAGRVFHHCRIVSAQDILLLFLAEKRPKSDEEQKRFNLPSSSLISHGVKRTKLTGGHVGRILGRFGSCRPSLTPCRPGFDPPSFYLYSLSTLQPTPPARSAQY